MKTYINYWDHEIHFPKDVAYYSDQMMWIKEESGDKLRIGISDLGVRAVKLLDYVRLKTRVGKEFKKGDLIGMVDTSKMVWEIIAPVSGKVVEVNEEIARGNPGPLMEDPYGVGWVFVVEKTSATNSELKTLHKAGTPEMEKWAEAIILKNVPLKG